MCVRIARELNTRNTTPKSARTTYELGVGDDGRRGWLFQGASAWKLKMSHNERSSATVD